MILTVDGHDFQKLTALAYEKQAQKKLGYLTLSITFYTPENRQINLIEKGRKAESLLCGVLYDKSSQISCYKVQRETGQHAIKLELR